MSYIFNEGFDGAAGSAPNGANWNIETGPGSSNDWGANNEQYYVNNQNILYQDGASNLIFKVGQLNTDGASGGEWPSGRVNTAGLYTLSDNQSCEIKVKVSPLLGLWPACWLLGGTAGTSSYAEVDMQESGDNNDNTYNVSSVTFWEGATPTNINSDVTFANATNPSSINPIPARVAGGYWTNYDSLTLGNVSSKYNLIWMFPATCSSNGTVNWPTPSSESQAQFEADLQAKRKAGVCCLLTVGGANNPTLYLSSAGNVTNFVNSVESLYNAWGGFDGLDIDIESSTQIDQNTYVVSMAQQLKAKWPGFNITICGFSPNYITYDASIAQSLDNAGVLDGVGVECYNLGTSTVTTQISNSESYLSYWAGYVGASKVIFGMEFPAPGGDGTGNVYASYTTAETVWNWAVTNLPGIRGAFVWNTTLDLTDNYFTGQIAPYIDASAPGTPSSGNNYVLDGNYHIWRFDMITTSIKIYIDGSLWCTLLKSNAPAWPYDGSPGMNIVLNVAVAPGNGYGTPSAAQLPWQSMAVDYVRIWSPAGPDPNTASTFVVGKETIKLQSVKMAAIN